MVAYELLGVLLYVSLYVLILCYVFRWYDFDYSRTFDVSWFLNFQKFSLTFLLFFVSFDLCAPVQFISQVIYFRSRNSSHTVQSSTKKSREEEMVSFFLPCIFLLTG